ncbi:hypothetical protein ACWA2B_10395 [Paenibacillus sp. CMM36]
MNFDNVKWDKVETENYLVFINNEEFILLDKSRKNVVVSFVENINEFIHALKKTKEAIDHNNKIIR